MSRGGVIIRRARGAGDRKDRKKEGELYAYEVGCSLRFASTMALTTNNQSWQALSRLLDVVNPAIQREQDFLADFLQITDSSLTFADYLNMEPLICRRAAASAGQMRPGTVKLIRGAMDLIFGFIPEQLRLWTDAALQRDPL